MSDGIKIHGNPDRWGKAAVVASRGLRKKQSDFARCIGKLIEFAYKNGYELTFGQALRTKEDALKNASAGTGIANSVHLISLAVDFNLFKDGKFLTDTESHTFLGKYWKTLDPDARWGGDFPKPDGNHYSFTHNGRA